MASFPVSVSLTFKIHYVANFSEAVYLLGSSKRLGSWDPRSAVRLEWNPGNWWTKSIEDVTDQSFDYKYFVGKFEYPLNNELRWEQGPNRSANLKGLIRKTIELNDVWEFKKVIFRLFESARIVLNSPISPNPPVQFFRKEISSPSPTVEDDQSLSIMREKIPSISSNSTQSTEDTPSPLPSSSHGVKEKYYITADVESLGNLMKPYKMKKMTQLALSFKTGAETRQRELVYWEKQILVKSSQQNMKYKYAYKSESKTSDEFERKTRKINFSKNDVDFEGAFCMSDKWILKSSFNFDEITSSLFLGPYPENLDQIRSLAARGVRAVFNLQTNHDMERHCVESEYIKEICENNGLSLIHFPVADMDPEDMALKLRESVEKLSNAVQKYERVYVHCTSGIYRSAQVLIAYLVLCEDFELNKAISLVESQRPITKKNREYIRSVFALNGGYGKSMKPSSANIATISQPQNSQMQQQSQKISLIEPRIIIRPPTPVSPIERKDQTEIIRDPSRQHITVNSVSCSPHSSNSQFPLSYTYSQVRTHLQSPPFWLSRQKGSFNCKLKQLDSFDRIHKKELLSISAESYWLEASDEQPVFPSQQQQRRRRNSLLFPTPLERCSPSLSA